MTDTMVDCKAGGDELEMVTCSVCMEVMNDPRALPCLHTFCYSCLDSILKGSAGGGKANPGATKISCPLCQEKHKVDKSGKGWCCNIPFS